MWQEKSMKRNGKYDSNSEAERHVCEVKCLVRIQGENGTWGGKSRVRTIQVKKQGGN